MKIQTSRLDATVIVVILNFSIKFVPGKSVCVALTRKGQFLDHTPQFLDFGHAIIADQLAHLAGTVQFASYITLREVADKLTSAIFAQIILFFARFLAISFYICALTIGAIKCNLYSHKTNTILYSLIDRAL